MRWLHIGLARGRALFRRDVIVDEIREEMDFHLDMRAKDYARAGFDERRARREAEHRFGNIAVLRDKGYDIRGGGLMESIWQDIRYGARSLRQSPTFTAVALTVLALAIGATTAIFSVVDAVVLRGLPYDEHDQIVAVFNTDPEEDPSLREGLSTPQTYLDWRRLQESFDGLAMVGNTGFQVKNARGEPASVPAVRATWEFLSVLRAKPILGRLFTEGDEVAGQQRVAILSHGFWQRQFGGTSDVVGKPLQLGNQSWLVVGVLSRDFAYPPGTDKPADLYVPMVFRDQDRVRGGGRGYSDAVIGRLKPDISLRVAEEQMNRVAAALDRQYPRWEPGRYVHVLSLHERLVGKARSWMLLLLASVSLVLLIACANVANLMLARATARTREIGVRTALGASRGRIARALLIESVMLSCVAGFLGIGIAYGGAAILKAWLPVDVPRVASIAIDLRVLAAAVGASMFTGVLFGLAPAVQTSRPDLTRALKDGDRSATSSRGNKRLRSAFVLGQVALATVLLTGAGLFIGSFINVMRVNTGFDYRNTLVMGVYTPRNGPQESYESWSARGAVFVRQVTDTLSSIPGVTSVAALNSGLPFTSDYSRMPVFIPGRSQQPTGEDASIDMRQVTKNYFSLLHIPLIEGRFFSDDDRAGSPRVMIINQAAAAKHWPGRSPIGERISDSAIVGVVGDIRQYGPEKPARQGAFIPFAQNPSSGASVLIKTAADPATLLPAVKAAIWSVNPRQMFEDEVLTLEGYMDRLLAKRRFNMALLGLLGALGLVIAAVGVFGVMAYTVARRSSEIGVRMALGATRQNIFSMVLKDAAVLIGCGLGIGTVAAWQLSGLAEAFLFQLRPTDLRVFAAALLTLALVGLAAAAIPARRAATIDPLRTLRES